jgi:hypothetical protein
MRKRFCAQSAAVGFLSSVNSYMTLQVTYRAKGLFTLRAAVFAIVNLHMGMQTFRTRKRFRAQSAVVGFPSSVNF